MDYYTEAKNHFKYTQKLRRDFHKHPELGFKEFRTAGIVAKELSKMGLVCETGIAETGVVALLEGEKPGPVVLLRFDMDALPVTEETGAEYASMNIGVMHACGHDAHTAMGLTIARVLNKHRDKINGTVKFVFQPAEESGGAERMVKEGVLENPRPDYSLSMHVWNNLPVGSIGITPGPTMAGADILRIVVRGKGGHAALPHMSDDPVLTSAHIITAIQSIVSRDVDPLQTAVVSVTMVRAGDAFNVIPSEVDMQGTIRTYLPSVRDTAFERVEKIINGVADSFGCRSEVEFTRLTPTLINDVDLAKQFQEIAVDLFPEGKIETDVRTMGSEDMAFLMQDIPGCYFFIGTKNTEMGFDAGHHNPHFDIDEHGMANGVALMTATAMELLQER
jgi:amidohydrolase